MSGSDYPSRSRNDYFASDDIARMRECFNRGLSAREASRQCKCSHRTANKYYSIFRNGGRPVPNRSMRVRPGGWEAYRAPRPVTLVKLKFMGEM